MDTEKLQLFVEAARAGSFAAVARMHNLDPSSVSRTITALEAELGVRLFQRSTRQLILSEAGARFLERVGPALEELQHACHDASSDGVEPAGKLRLTTSTAFGQLRVVPLLEEFRRRYPQIGLECLFTDETLDLIDQRIDLAIRLTPAVVGDVIATRLVDTRYRVVAAPSYLEHAPPLVAPADISAHACLLLPYRGFRSAWHFRAADGDVSEHAVHGDLVLSSPLALRDTAIFGLGPALLPDWLVEEAMEDGRLVDAFPAYEITATTFDTGVWLVYPSRRFLPHKVRAFIDFMKDQFTAPIPPREKAG